MKDEVYLGFTFRRAMHHGVGVIHAHTVGAAVLTYQIHDGVVGFFAGPVALVLEKNLLPVTGTAPACTMRSIERSWASTDVPPEVSVTT